MILKYRRMALRDRTHVDANKIQAVYNKGRKCHGCNEDFYGISKKIINMCFELAHEHSKKCKLRINGNNDHFYICQDCNRKQGSKCGFFHDGVFMAYDCKQKGC